MKNHQQYLISICFLTIASCCAMQQSKQKFTTLSLRTTRSPYQIKFLTDNNLIMNDGHECIIFDLLTQEKINTINTRYFNANLTVHPNRTQFAIVRPRSCTIHDATNYAELWSINNPIESNMYSSFFSPTDNSIIIQYYDNQLIQHFPTKQPSYVSTISNQFTLHPKELEWCSFNNFGEVFINSTEQPFLHKILDLNIGVGVLTPRSCQYSDDGNFIVVQYLRRMYIIKPSDNTNSAHYSFKKIIPAGRCIFKTIMHPNSSVIITILSADNTLQDIEYWDMHTTDCIYKTPNTDFPFNAELACHYEAYTISPNGKQLLITISDKCDYKCIILPIPFEVIYHPITKKQLQHILFMLNNYQHENNLLPKDITYYLMKILLQSCKR